jgi:hypothetical protein
MNNSSIQVAVVNNLLYSFCPIFVPPILYFVPHKHDFCPTSVLLLSLPFVRLLSLNFCPTFILLLTLFVLSSRTKVGQKA